MKINSFTPNPDLVLTDYLYDLLLKEICRRLDPAGFFTRNLGMNITVINQAQARSNCPWCGGQDTFLIDRSNGSCECGGCFERVDLLTLLCKVYGMPLPTTVARLTGILEGKEELEPLELNAQESDLPKADGTAKGGAA